MIAVLLVDLRSNTQRNGFFFPQDLKGKLLKLLLLL